MGWLIALGALILIGLIPVGLCGSYCSTGTQLYLYVGPVRIFLYPSKKDDKKSSKQAKSGENSPAQRKEQSGIGGKLSDFLPIVKTVLEFFGELIKKIKVKKLILKVILGGSDPCDLSVNYGRTCAAVANIQPHLDRLFVIKKQDISVNCDYTADESVVTACLDITICLVRLFVLVIRYGLRAIKQYFILYNKRKGGAEQ